MPELGTSGSAGGPGWATAQVYPTALDLALSSPVLITHDPLRGRFRCYKGKIGSFSTLGMPEASECTEGEREFS
jgi:hypothetical protein